MVNVKVPNHKGGVGEVGKGNQRGYRHPPGPLGPEVVYVENTKVRNRFAEQAYPKQVKGSNVGPIKESR